MRILVLNWRDLRHPDAGGAELYVQSLCSELVKMGHKVHFYSSSFPGAQNEEEIEEVRITRCGGRFSVYWSVCLQYLRNRRKYDAVLESINTVPFFVRFYATQPVVPIIYSINNGKALIKELGITPLSLVGWLGNLLIPTIYRRAAVVTISESGKNELKTAGFNPRRVFVAKPGVSTFFENLVKTTPEFARPNNRIIYVGRLKKYKGIDILIQAVALLRRRLPVELLIVGKGDYEGQLRRMATELGVADNVKFKGFVSEEQKVMLLKSSSVFVCCSIDEGGWTIAGLEALKCGVPLVVTDSHRDLVQNGITGFLIPPQPKIVAEKVREVIEKDWESMSIASSRSCENITLKNSALVTLEAFESATHKYHPDHITRHRNGESHQ